jgi:protein phosphatase
MLIDCDGLSVKGQNREENQDQFLIADLNKSMTIHKTSLLDEYQRRISGEPQGKLFVVADGVGGQPGGGDASAIAVDGIIRYVLNAMPWFYSLSSRFTYEIRDRMKNSFEMCRFQVRGAAALLDKQGMATTLTMAYMLWPRLYLIHVGDNRAYLFREQELEQITTDHTVAAELSKQSDENFDKKPPFGNVLLDAVGMDTASDTYEGKKTEFKALDLKAGDILLLCTDGLSDAVDEKTIISKMERGQTANEICLKLLTATQENGGNDDTTIIVARFGN